MAIIALASVTAGSPNSGTITTSSIDTTGASLIVLAVGKYDAGINFTVSDSAGNTWTALTAQTYPSSNKVLSQLYYCASPSTSSSHTFTVAGFAYPSVAVVAFSGTAASPFDAENGSSTPSGSNIQPGSLTPSENGCVVVTGLAGETNTTGISINSSFTAISTGYSGGNHEAAGIAYKIQTTAGAENPTWSNSGGGNHLAATIASFKSSGGGGGSGKPFNYYAMMHRRRAA